MVRLMFSLWFCPNKPGITVGSMVYPMFGVGMAFIDIFLQHWSWSFQTLRQVLTPYWFQYRQRLSTGIECQVLPLMPFTIPPKKSEILSFNQAIIDLIPSHSPLTISLPTPTICGIIPLSVLIIALTISGFTTRNRFNDSGC